MERHTNQENLQKFHIYLQEIVKSNSEFRSCMKALSSQMFWIMNNLIATSAVKKKQDIYLAKRNKTEKAKKTDYKDETHHPQQARVLNILCSVTRVVHTN